MFDNLQGFAICSTCQMLLLQLIYDMRQVPTVDMVSANTDAIMFYVDEEYKEQTDEVIHNWEKLTGHEMEEDKIVKIVMNNVNNYCELVQTGDNDYTINYKGGYFRGKHKFIWDKEQRKFHYKFEDDLESNSLTICSEALLKNLMFDIKPEDVIYNCNDVFRFQMVSHLGHTYEKCVQESENGDIELQRNNRIYASKKPSGAIIKIKADGRRDSVAGQPPNPVVDNGAMMKIEDINKDWYVDLAYEWISDFKGIKRIEDYKVNELKDKATEYGIPFDKKTKKAQLITLIKNYEKNKRKSLTNLKQNDTILTERKFEMKKEELEKEVERLKNENEMLQQEQPKNTDREDTVKLLKKINEFRKAVQEHEFVLDKAMDAKLGGGEYSSIGQFYNCVQQTCLQVGLDFQFDTIEVNRFERELLKPSVGSPRHMTEVVCEACFTDIDTGCMKIYRTMGAGSDSLDKGLGAAQTMSFRNWFKFNFTPKEKFDWDSEDSTDETTVTEVSESKSPKVPVYIPPAKKEEIKKEVVATEQHESFDTEVVNKIADMVMQIREKTGDNNYASELISLLQTNSLTTPEIDAVRIKIENRYYDVVGA